MSAGPPEAGLQRRRSQRPDPILTPAHRFSAFAEAVEIWVVRIRTRRRLAHLSDHMLKDIGVSAAEVAREAGKPFWRK